MIAAVASPRAVFAAWLACLVLVSAPAWAQRRVALVIGNSAYGSENKLSNPVNDARLMARTLRSLGFTVELKTDLGKRDMELAIARITRESVGADSAVVYYAGHGAQLVGGGRNFLLPVDARIDDDDTLQSDGIPADRIVEQLERSPSPAKLRLVILDACRNNSLAGKARSGVRGLARMTPSSDFTLIAFSTNDQDVALDGSGEHSPYTRALAKHLARANELPLRRIFELTATEVRETTRNQQRPRTYGDLDSRAMLDGRVLEVTAAEPPAPAAANDNLPPSADQVEVQAWTAVKNANLPAGYRAYLAEYPDGRFAKFARIELARLEAAPPAARGNDAGPVPNTRPAPGVAPAVAPPERPAAPPAEPTPASPVARVTAVPVPVPASAWNLQPVPGRVYRYRITDKAYGKTQELQRQVSAVADGRVVFGGGGRVEDTQGRLLAPGGNGSSDFELIEPPQGWASLLQEGGAVDLAWTARDGLQLTMGQPQRRRASITVDGRTHEAVVVTWDGRAQWPTDLISGANYIVRLELGFDPQTRRVLRFTSLINASRSGLTGFRNSSEEVVLLASP
ncbi:MAG: caspase family protein [Rubrivivax sp.]